MVGKPEAGGADYLASFLERVLQDRVPSPDNGEQVTGAVVKGAGRIGNVFGASPTFWADAPWRLEPDEEGIPLTFLVRDGEEESLGLELREIAVYEAPEDGQPWAGRDWRLVRRYTEGLGRITRRYWAYHEPSAGRFAPPTIPLGAFRTAARGQHLSLKVEFRGVHRGGILQSPKDLVVWRPLLIYLASEALPLRHSSQWYYGDTHYHSSYTNDLKEFGNPIPDTRAAAACIGLDWLVVTDHSVDLANSNPYWEESWTGSRWEDLGSEIAAWSDDRVRLLRGEEVTLLGAPGAGDDTLHLLIFGAGLREMIPGAWAREGWLQQVATRLERFSGDLFRYLFGPIYKLEAILTGVRSTGEVEPALSGRSVYQQGALAYAAHPASFAQAPGGEWTFADLSQPIHGVEAWNARVQRHTGKEESPFEHWEPAGDWAASASKKGIDSWDAMLRQKVALPDPRYILLGGSDAHGSFNYSEGWWADWDGMRADDNGLGKVRTLLYLPDRALDAPRRAPTELEIESALRSGSCVVTDGPVVTLALRFGGRRASLGEILTLDGDGTLDVEVQATSTEEFGAVDRVRVHYYFQGMGETMAQEVPYAVGDAHLLVAELPTTPGYVRVSTETSAGSETYRCFSNPIWVKPGAVGERALRLCCVRGGG